MARHPACCQATGQPGSVFDPFCKQCQAEYLEGRGLTPDAVRLAIVNHAGPGVAMLDFRFGGSR